MNIYVSIGSNVDSAGDEVVQCGSTRDGEGGGSIWAILSWEVEDGDGSSVNIAALLSPPPPPAGSAGATVPVAAPALMVYRLA